MLPKDDLFQILNHALLDYITVLLMRNLSNCFRYA